MNKRVYLLMIVSFVVGMIELLIGGILDLIAQDLSVSLGQAGFLITIFSLMFAIAGPILLVLTAHIERKRLMLISLVIFFIGTLVSVFSTTYYMLFIGRIITAISGALLTILCLVIAPRIVAKKYRGRAIGIVSMGVSGSIVLGLPIGMFLGNAYNWRAPFILIGILTLLSFIGVYFFMEKLTPKQFIPIGVQLATLKNKKILFAHITMFLFLAGHTTLYAYFKPFLQTSMGLNATWISIIYFIFGVAAVSGGGLGGLMSDRVGTRQTILWTIIIFGISLFALPYATFSLPLFIVVMIIWGMMNWALTPALQSYLINIDAKTSEIQQSLNNSALHFGIAFGSFIGGIAIEHTSVVNNAFIGGFIIILSLVAAVISLSYQSNKKRHAQGEKS